MNKGSKLFLCLLSGVALTIGAACSVVEGTVQKSNGGEEIAESLDQNELSTPETGLYVTSSGEEIPISHTMGSYIIPDSFRELVETSDTIIIGKSLEAIEESEVRITHAISDGSFGDAFSVTEFKVEKTLKGDFQEGSVVPVGQSAAILSGADFGPLGTGDKLSLVILAPENYRPLEKGASYILFLRQGVAFGSDVYFPTGHTTGRVNVDGADELRIELPVQQKIWDYALKLYQAAIKAPNQNPIDLIVEQSDQDFMEASVNAREVEIDPAFNNVQDVEVESLPETVEILPPAIERLKAM